MKGWRLRGEIALARRELDAAEDAFRRALAIAEAIGNPTQLWKTTPRGHLHAPASARTRPERPTGPPAR